MSAESKTYEAIQLTGYWYASSSSARTSRAEAQLASAHRTSPEVRGLPAHLMHLQSEVQQKQRRHNSQTQSNPPDGIEVVHAEDPEADEAHEVGDGECEVEHRVGS